MKAYDELNEEEQKEFEKGYDELSEEEQEEQEEFVQEYIAKMEAEADAKREEALPLGISCLITAFLYLW